MEKRLIKTSLLRDPLVHFLFLGLILFLINLTFPGTGNIKGQVIEITEADVARLAKGWEIQRLRMPTAGELRGLVDAEIREQVLYREAQKLGLQNNDVIVRRRLAQKLEFLIEAEGTGDSVADDVLKAYFNEHADRYRIPARVTFSHIYFSPDERSDPFRDASKVLASLRKDASHPLRAPEMGDRFSLAYDYSSLRATDIARDFGLAFANSLVTQRPNQWSGPLESGLGWHLVYVTRLIPASAPAFEAVRTRLLSDYRYDQRNVILQAALQNMQQHYTVKLPAMFSKVTEKSL